MFNVIKKDGRIEEFNPDKIKRAVSLSAKRVEENTLWKDEKKLDEIVSLVVERMTEDTKVENMHHYVELALDKISPPVADSYRSYRNWKQDFCRDFEDVYKRSIEINHMGDKENSNTDSALVATQRCLTLNELEKKLYRRFHLKPAENQACHEGYLYVHDQSSRRYTMNCCLFRAGEVMRGGFEMGNIKYTEPKTLAVAFNVLSDIILSTASQQYGGFTVPEVDKIMGYYAEKSMSKHYDDTYELLSNSKAKLMETLGIDFKELDYSTKVKIDNDTRKESYEYAYKLLQKEAEQGYQGIEMKLNTVGSSRGDYPFVTFTFGLDDNPYSSLITDTILKVHEKGQGEEGKERPVLFPKLVFLYDKNKHGKNKPQEYKYDEAIQCSSATMYPDYLSLTGEGYVPEMYKKYGKVVSPMGCRAFLSPWYERGGMKPADENDVPVFEGRFNVGAITLHLPMILAKSRRDNVPFFEVLDHYLEMAREIHQRTYEYLGNMKASTNPLAYCEGGFYGGNLKPDEKIAPLLKSATASFGYTALNELQELYNGKSICEDGQFALDTLQHINDKINEFKEEDGILYAIYGTPAESLVGLQVEQFRREFGVIDKVSDRGYVSNSFHCHVTEEIRPTQKQDLEYRFWNLSNGGKIQYCRYNLPYNVKAIKSLVTRAMDMGLYEGVNLSLSYCADCGHFELGMTQCSKCGSTDIVSIDRMNGYLSYSRVKGDSRLNDAKMEEIADRVSM